MAWMRVPDSFRRLGRHGWEQVHEFKFSFPDITAVAMVAAVSTARPDMNEQRTPAERFNRTCGVTATWHYCFMETRAMFLQGERGLSATAGRRRAMDSDHTPSGSMYWS